MVLLKMYYSSFSFSLCILFSRYRHYAYVPTCLVYSYSILWICFLYSFTCSSIVRLFPKFQFATMLQCMYFAHGWEYLGILLRNGLWSHVGIINCSLPYLWLLLISFSLPVEFWTKKYAWGCNISHFMRIL